MGTGTGDRETFNVLSLLLDARDQAPAGDDPERAVVDDTPTSSPLRSTLQKRSPTDFLTDARDALTAEGMTADAATHALVEAVNRPALAVRAPGRGDKVHRLLHAVVVRHDDGGALLVAAEIEVAQANPPHVTRCQMHAIPFDPDEPRDRADVADRLAQWWTQYALRQLTPGPAGAPEHLAWLGDPTRAGYRDVPADWRNQATATAAALGLTVRFVLGSVEAPQAVLPLAGVVLTVNGTDWAPEHSQRLTDAGALDVAAGTPGTPFAELLATARQALVEAALDATKPAGQAPRELKAGETLYHRKVGDSRGHYDTFDAGSTTPCVHGANAYNRWNGADKAYKGMARRYTNMQKNMLLHCKHYPNCGVYAASRPA